MMKSMMKRMMPMMNGTIEKMTFKEKEEMMVRMMPRMMSNLSFEEKMRLMTKMMPMMMDTMQEKGIEVHEMMRMMCPKCFSVASSEASEEEKTKLKEEMQKNLDLI